MGSVSQRSFEKHNWEMTLAELPLPHGFEAREERKVAASEKILG